MNRAGGAVALQSIFAPESQAETEAMAKALISAQPYLLTDLVASLLCYVAPKHARLVYCSGLPPDHPGCGSLREDARSLAEITDARRMLEGADRGLFASGCSS